MTNDSRVVPLEVLQALLADIREEAEYQVANYQEPNLKMVHAAKKLRAIIDAPGVEPVAATRQSRSNDGSLRERCTTHVDGVGDL